MKKYTHTTDLKYNGLNTDEFSKIILPIKYIYAVHFLSNDFKIIHVPGVSNHDLHNFYTKRSDLNYTENSVEPSVKLLFDNTFQIGLQQKLQEILENEGTKNGENMVIFETEKCSLSNLIKFSVQYK